MRLLCDSVLLPLVAVVVVVTAVVCYGESVIGGVYCPTIRVFYKLQISKATSQPVVLVGIVKSPSLNSLLWQ